MAAAAALVEALVADGALDEREAASLDAKLDAALEALARGRENAAESQLRAAANQVRALERSGRLAADGAARLLGAIEGAVEALRGG